MGREGKAGKKKNEHEKKDVYRRRTKEKKTALEERTEEEEEMQQHPISVGEAVPYPRNLPRGPKRLLDSPEQKEWRFGARRTKDERGCEAQAFIPLRSADFFCRRLRRRLSAMVLRLHDNASTAPSASAPFSPREAIHCRIPLATRKRKRA